MMMNQYRNHSQEYKHGYQEIQHPPQYNDNQYNEQHYSQPQFSSVDGVPPLDDGKEGQQQEQQFVPPLTHTNLFQSDFLNTRGNFTAGISYVGLWLTGLLVLLFERKNRFARFHAMQSLLFFGGVNVLYIVFINIMIHEVPLLFGFAIFAFVIMNIIAVVAWFVGMISAFSGKYVKLPIVGDIAERYVNEQARVK